MATTRLRKTFHYPAGDIGDDDDVPTDLDEEGRHSLPTVAHRGLIVSLRTGEADRAVAR